tara:strand:+ start:1524 stop:2249 length:726 start_codon:yes stop_codon:yes gene_type:complete
MHPIVISFYSDIEGHDYYSRNAERLKKQLDNLGVPYDIQEKKSLGDYRLNCLSKPQYILDKMEKLDQPVIWLDIDSRVHKKLADFENIDPDVDIVFSSSMMEEVSKFMSEHGLTEIEGHLLPAIINGMKASPLYFGNTTGSKNILYGWIQSTRNQIETNDPKFDHEPLFPILGRAIQDKTINSRVVGIDYCTWPGNTKRSTVITMGLADSETKKEKLREMGLEEEFIEWQSGGDKEHVWDI